MYKLMFYLTIVNIILHHCHSVYQYMVRAASKSKCFEKLIVKSQQMTTKTSSTPVSKSILYKIQNMTEQANK